MKAVEKIFGTHSERELKRIYPIVDKIEALRPTMQALSDEELRGKTKEYKKRLEDGETLDDLLPEAFATVREAAKRVLGMEHYRDHNVVINLRNAAMSKIKSTVGTMGDDDCREQGNKARFSSNVDCSSKQEGIIVRCSIEAHRL